MAGQSRRFGRLRNPRLDRLRRLGATSFTSKRKISHRRLINTQRRCVLLVKGCVARKAMCS